jgi:hypothetical protein
MLGNIAVVVVGNANVEQNIKQHREVEQRKIQAKSLVANRVLYRPVDTKNPHWFYQQIQEK